jgi:uncharacterized protein YndB with AHSA1/START domain
LDVPDRIERELTLPVPIEQVWAALTEPNHLREWFGPALAEVDLRPGGQARFGWKVGGEVYPAVVETVEPPTRFSYRWEPGAGGTDGITTLVEFTLEELPGGTRLRLVESGFSALPPSYRADNDDGWTEELGELEAYLAR